MNLVKILQIGLTELGDSNHAALGERCLSLTRHQQVSLESFIGTVQRPRYGGTMSTQYGISFASRERELPRELRRRIDGNHLPKICF
jgi:hypothetical protein